MKLVEGVAVQLIHRHGGMFMLVDYLRSCGSPDITKQILARFGAKIHPTAQPIGPWITVHEPGNDFSNLEVGRRYDVQDANGWVATYWLAEDKLAEDDGMLTAIMSPADAAMLAASAASNP